MYRMEQYYSKLMFKGVEVSKYNSSAFYSNSKVLGIRVRNYVHNKFDNDIEIPTLYFTKDYFYKDYRTSLPDHPSVTLKD